MSSPSHFDICVARKINEGKRFGPYHRHLFTTRLDDTHSAQLAYDEIKDRFPSKEFDVTVTYWNCSGEDQTSAFLNASAEKLIESNNEILRRTGSPLAKAGRK